MAMQQSGKIDVYVFGDQSLGLPEQYRNGQPLPAGVRYLATVVGYRLPVFEIVEVAQLADLATVVPSAFGPPGGGAGAAPPDPETAKSIGPYFLKTSQYHEASAFVRIKLGAADPQDALQDVRASVGHDEAQIVQGHFDTLAYIGANTDEEIFPKVVKLRQDVKAIKDTVTLQVIDYVSRSPNAPPGHKVP